MKIVSVLRTGVEYQAKHAQYLHRQLVGYDATCFTDLPHIAGVDTLPISSDEWPGWWSKMEVFNPDNALGSHDLLYIDIDSHIVGDLLALAHAVKGCRKLVMLSDFYHPEHAASGVMYIPACVKRRVWGWWMKNEYWYMVRRHRPGRMGDQGVISEIMPDALRWDVMAPGAIVSYKKHVIGPDSKYWVPGVSTGNGTVPEGARIVAYHGEPRPWECK
jgi:hypothetical protein